MITAIFIIPFVLASPPPGGELQPLPELVEPSPPVAAELTDPLSPGTAHTDSAHETLRMKVRVKLVPSLRSYESLAQDVVDQLSFMDSVESAAEYLDGMRNSMWTTTLEKSLPGFAWLTLLYDKLRDLTGQVSRVKKRLGRLKLLSTELLKASERYTKTPTDEHFNALMRGYEGAKKEFEQAQAAFDELREFSGDLDGLLGKVRGVTVHAAKLPFVEDEANGLRDDIDKIQMQLTMLGQVLKLAKDAIDRDTTSLDDLQGVFDEAHAHDAYDHAQVLASSGRLGTALSAFRDVRTRWPDTQWAHRSDQKVVDLVAEVDEVAAKLAAAEAEAADLRAQLQIKPKVEIRTVEKIRVVTQDVGTPRPWAWALGGAGLVGLLWGGLRLKRRLSIRAA